MTSANLTRIEQSVKDGFNPAGIMLDTGKLSRDEVRECIRRGWLEPEDDAAEQCRRDRVARGMA